MHGHLNVKLYSLFRLFLHEKLPYSATVFFRKILLCHVFWPCLNVGDVDRNTFCVMKSEQPIS